jgi:hypothetical protein
MCLTKGGLTIIEKNKEDALKKKKESETRKSDLQKKADDKYFLVLQKMTKNVALNKDDMKVLLA